MLRFRLFSVLSLLVIVAVAAGCGGGGSSAPALTTVTVQVAVTSATPIASLQFTLDNTGTAAYVANSATVVTPPSPGVTASQSANHTTMAFLSTGVSNPVIQAQFQVSGSPQFSINPSAPPSTLAVEALDINSNPIPLVISGPGANFNVTIL